MSTLVTTAKRMLRRIGLDVIRFPTRDRVPLAAFLQRFRIETVLDVGANAGQYGDWLRTLGYGGQIISFEPNPEPYSRLTMRAKADSLWQCHNLGVGEHCGSATLRVSDLDVFSSMLESTGYLRTLDPRATARRELSVPVTSLDVFLAEHPVSGRVLLKIDTQGSEQPVISGASGLLEQAVGVQVELSVLPLYETQPCIEEMISTLRGLGYVPYAFWEGFTDPNSGAVLEMDGIFVRSGALMLT